MNALIAIGGIGGLIALLSAIIIIGRGIFRQVNATEDNTEALNGLSAKVEKLSHTANGHETRLAILEDRVKR